MYPMASKQLVYLKIPQHDYESEICVFFVVGSKMPKKGLGFTQFSVLTYCINFSKLRYISNIEFLIKVIQRYEGKVKKSSC
jgi:hypothetical protein